MVALTPTSSELAMRYLDLMSSLPKGVITHQKGHIVGDIAKTERGRVAILTSHFEELQEVIRDRYGAAATCYRDAAQREVDEYKAKLSAWINGCVGKSHTDKSLDRNADYELTLFLGTRVTRAFRAILEGNLVALNFKSNNWEERRDIGPKTALDAYFLGVWTLFPNEK